MQVTGGKKVMVKATITVTDAANGVVNLTCEFEPEITAETHSAAVKVVLAMIEHVGKMAREVTTHERD
jgi:hypothetical protein